MAKLCFFGDYIFSRENIVQTFISRSIGLSEYGSHLTIELMSLSRTTPGDVAWMMRQESFVANRWGGGSNPINKQPGGWDDDDDEDEDEDDDADDAADDDDDDDDDDDCWLPK